MGGLRGHFMVEGDFLHAPDAMPTPDSSGDALDQGPFGRSLRIVFPIQALDQFEEGARLFVFQDDVLRKETMTGAVAGGGVFAFRGDGAF